MLWPWCPPRDFLQARKLSGSWEKVLSYFVWNDWGSNTPYFQQSCRDFGDRAFSSTRISLSQRSVTAFWLPFTCCSCLILEDSTYLLAYDYTRLSERQLFAALFSQMYSVYWHLYRIQYVRHKLSYFKQFTWKLLGKVLPNQMQQVLSTKRTIQILQQTHCGLVFLMYETSSVVIANSSTVIQRQNIITTPILKFVIFYLFWIWALFEPNPGTPDYLNM